MSNRVSRYVVLAIIVIAAPVVAFTITTLAYRLYRWAAELIGVGNYEYVATCGVLVLATIVVCAVIVKCME